MTIRREAFILEYQLAKQNNNVEFMMWLSEIFRKAEGDDINE